MSNDLYVRRTYEPFKFLGRFFWVPLQVLDSTPRASLTQTWEENGERWSPTLVVRVPFTRLAVGFGWWQDVPQDSIIEVHEDDAEYDAYCAVNGNVSRETWQAAREEIVGLGLDPEEEMALMQEMGIFE